jgi:predicted SAM-dependent methyltransferase
MRDALETGLRKSGRRRRIRAYLDTHESRKLQLGCGKNILEGWCNTDLYRDEDVLYLDAKEPFPCDDRTFDYIFCEHLIEHCEYREGMHMLRECFRVLRPGGKIRIATPDLLFVIRLNDPEKTEAQKRYIAWAAEHYLPDVETCRDVFVIHNFFRSWGHKVIYDFKALQDLMKAVGFVSIARHDVGESSDKNLQKIESHGNHIGDDFNRLETFVIEGEKPA